MIRTISAGNKLKHYKRKVQGKTGEIVGIGKGRGKLYFTMLQFGFNKWQQQLPPFFCLCMV